MGLARGCGTRVEGGIYLVSAVSKNGHPIWEFLKDSPLPVDLNALNIGAHGIYVLERQGQAPDGTMVGMGVYDVWDVVGAENYPDVADFIMETAHMGLSRRASTSTEFAKLTRESRIMLLHSKAIISNREGYSCQEPPATFKAPESIFEPGHCPNKMRALHCNRPGPLQHGAFPNEQCSRLYFQDLTLRQGDTYVPHAIDEHGRDREVFRTMPGGFGYKGFLTPERTFGSKHSMGLFMVMPLTGIEVIKSLSEPGRHVAAQDQASMAGVPVTLEDE